MDETTISFPDWDNNTVLHPLGLAATIILGIATMMVSRKYALWPLIFLACLIAPAQRVVLVTLDFSLLRIMLMFAWARMFMRGEAVGLKWKPIDTVMVLWMAVRAIAYCLLRGTLPAATYAAGFTFDSVLMYFLFRFMIRDAGDFRDFVKGWIVVSVPVALAFMIERTTGRNAFAVFGGLPAITVVREGKMRCQGAFPHPIIAGCFWAGLLPLIASRWWSAPKSRSLTILGLFNAGAIVVICNSSTPILGIMSGLVAACMFPMRAWMRPVRWAAVFTLIGLHMVMKAPVWHLVSRIDLVGGSTGWHRYHLIDQAIKHFGEWWALGTTDTEHWGDGLADVTNQYIAEAVEGGLFTMLLFCVVIALAFKGLGQGWRHAARDRVRVIEYWCLGVALFVHLMNFIAVSYFGQILLVWFATLAICASLTPAAAPIVPRSWDPQPAPQFTRRERRTGTFHDRVV